jgi:PIN domain nuclease of toxin-antitoxin system
MKRYLLDTHTLLWMDTETEKLGEHGRRIVRSRSSSLFVSAISIYELSQKARKGKLAKALPFLEKVEQNVQAYGMTMLDVNALHTQQAGALEWKNNDPFDRILAAQAMIEGLVLITSDSAFASLPGLTTLW